MSNGKPKPTNPKSPGPTKASAPAKTAAPAKGAAGQGPPPPAKPAAPVSASLPPLYRKIDWIAFGLTTLLVFIGYLLTLAPDLTLEDSGELAVGSYYAGVPHPPGYPVWTMYTWLFTALLPISNVAYRVAISSAVAGAFACGLISLMVSRGCSMILEGIAEFKAIERRWENVLCLVSAVVAGMLMGFNGFMWSQAVIVEVYTLSVLSLTLVLCCLLRWLYAPVQRRYLYLSFFWFGICFNNHQSLLVVAIAMEICAMAVQARLGRDFFLGNSLIWVVGIFLKETGKLSLLAGNTPLYVIYNLIGLGSVVMCVWLTAKTKRILTEWKPVLLSGLAFLAGAAFYLYMPIASMTNPPMNWAYPRTVGGFVHAMTRGQYERVHPTAGTGNTAIEVASSFCARYADQMFMLVDGAMEEFTLVYLVIGIVPFLFFLRLQARERAWIVGLGACYLFLGPFLLLLLNPATDRQSRDLNKPFFTASHVLISMGIGYGLTLAAATLLLQYERFRTWMLGLGAALSAMSLFTLVITCVKFSGGQTSMGGLKLIGHALRQAFAQGHIRPEYCAALLLLALTLSFLFIVLFCRTRIRLWPVIALFALMPVTPILFHWADNEQHGHLFGFWFGHDMFTPPFSGPDGKLTYDPKLRADLLKKPEGALIYPEMARDTILFGGTDPGRFCPTYMIFCESFIPPQKRRDPNFDRRDVYIITQNALADGTYLQYIRAHYNRSTQIDPPFFQEIFRSEKERELNYKTNLLARAFSPLDTFFLGLGRRIESHRRADGVYPPKEILTPSNEDSGRCFQEYLEDAQRRMRLGQLKPGEDIRIIDNRMQVQGQVAVMSINGLLTKVIFDKNPNSEFYVEESFPLDWMYPHLEPFGIIMKINRRPLVEMNDQIIARDHHFWSVYSDRLIGNWITYDTSIADVCKFAERTYIQHNYAGFKGDPKFVRDNDGQKAFSKLRSSIGGVYAWRVDNASPPNSPQQKAMLKEAEFALKQAYAYCPYSPEALFRLSNLLLGMARQGQNRIDDALLLAETSLKMDPYNAQIENLLKELHRIKNSTAGLTQAQTNLARFEKDFRANPQSAQSAYNLIAALAQLQDTNRIFQVLDQMLSNPVADSNAIMLVASVAQQLGNTPRVESALERLVKMQSESPEAWYDLAAIRAMQSKAAPALDALAQALQLNTTRLAKSPGSVNLVTQLLADGRFNLIRSSPEFIKLLPPK